MADKEAVVKSIERHEADAPSLLQSARQRPLWRGMAALYATFDVRTLKPGLLSILRSTYRNRYLYAIDLGLAALALMLSLLLRLNSDVLVADPQSTAALSVLTVMFVVVCAITFPLAGLYKRNWKYASILDYVILVRAVLISALILVACLFFYSRAAFVPRSVIAIETVLLTVFLAGVRLSFRQEDLRRRTPAQRGSAVNAGNGVPVLLVGARHEADLYLRALHRDPAAAYRPVGFIEASANDVGLILHGVPVLGTPEEFDAIVAMLERQQKKPRHLIFTVPLSALPGDTAERLIGRADAQGLTVSRLNSATSLRKAGMTSDFELRPIELTDLLERSQSVLDMPALRRFVCGRRVLVTGAGGSIGSELVKQIAALDPSQIVMLDSCEFNIYAIDLELSERFPGVVRAAHLCDVRDEGRVNELFARYRPELVFHAAALKHVPMVELNPCEGLLTNVCGTMNVAEAVKRWGALGMVQISTDKAVNSTSIMGATKRLAELYCQALDIEGMADPRAPRFMTVRFGNVLGSSGSLIPLFERQLARGGPLTVTHPDMTRYFMTIREAVELTLQASAYGLEGQLGQGEIFVLDMGRPIRIMDVARRMISLAGFDPDRDIGIEIVGCRPGEKLFEELFDVSERRVTPPVPGVLGAVPNAVPLSRLYRAFADLRASAIAGDTERLRETIRTILPDFGPPREDDDMVIAAELAAQLRAVPAGMPLSA